MEATETIQDIQAQTQATLERIRRQDEANRGKSQEVLARIQEKYGESTHPQAPSTSPSPTIAIALAAAAGVMVGAGLMWLMMI